MRFTSDIPTLKVSAPSYGVKVEFENGSYETEDPNEIHVLRRTSEATISKDELYEEATEREIPGRSELPKEELGDRVETDIAQEAIGDPEQRDPRF